MSSGWRVRNMKEANREVKDDKERRDTANDEELDEDGTHDSDGLDSDPKAAFQRALAQNPLKYTGPSADLAVGLQKFFDIFLTKDAELGLPQFHSSRGDSEVTVEEWRQINETRGAAQGGVQVAVHARTVGLRTPVVAPIGPSSTRVSKTQCCRVYGSHGMTVETKAHFLDIPYGDCFNVIDRWVITPTPEDANKVNLVVTFEIEWLKGTMWKKTIEGKTQRDMNEFFTAYTKVMVSQAHSASSNKQGATAADALPPAPPPVEAPKAEASSGTSAQGERLASHVSYVIWGIFLILFYLVLTFRSASSKQALVAEEMAALREALRDTQAKVAGLTALLEKQGAGSCS